MIKDEEENLAACINSANPFVDEILVLDTGSKDKSIEIAKDCGATVREILWPESFAEARNQSIKYAKGDWILILDGDERLDDQSLRVLQSLELDSTSAEAFEFEIINFLSDQRQLSFSNSQRQIRLFRNRSKYRYAGRVHHQLLDLKTQSSLPAQYCGAKIFHDGYTPQSFKKQSKKERLKLLQLAVKENPSDAFARHNLANHYKILEQFKAALQEYYEAIRLVGQQPGLDWEIRCWFSAAYCAIRLELYEEAIDLCNEILAIYPNLADAQLRLAEALINTGQVERALDGLIRFQKASDQEAQKTSAIRWFIPLRTAECLMALKRYPEALGFFNALSQAEHQDAEVYCHQAICAVRSGQIRLAKEASDKAYSLNPSLPASQKLNQMFAHVPQQQGPVSQ